MDETAQTTKRAPGRPKGALNTKACRERGRALAQAEVKPLDVLLKTMAERWKAAEAEQDQEAREKLQDKACQVAKEVAPYLHAKLQATTIKGDGDNPLAFTMQLPASDVLKAMIRGGE